MVDDSETPVDEASVLGPLTPRRVLRVFTERWLWLFLFLVGGMVLGWATARALPQIYEAERSFTMDLTRMAAGLGGEAGNISYADIYNTRLYEWVSEPLLLKVVQQYRTDFPNAMDSDQQVFEALSKSRIELQRNSRLVTVTVGATSTNLCRGLVTSYVDVIAAHSLTENARRGETSAAVLRKKADDQRALISKLTDDLMRQRVLSRVNVLKTDLDRLTLSCEKVSEEVREQEAEFAELIAWGKVLVAAGRDPEKFGTLSVKVPRSAEIQAEYRAMRDIEDACRSQLSVFTKFHPGVRQTGRSVLAARKRFDEAVQRARDTCKAKLLEVRKTLSVQRKRLNDLTEERAALETRIATAEGGEMRLVAELNLARKLMEQYALEESRIASVREQQGESIVITGPATVSEGPVFPNPLIVYGVAAGVSLLLGVVFILMLDYHEGHVSGLRDIEEKIGLPVLTVIPHVSRSQRENVARILIDDPHSRFAESVAILRNLLESPTYSMVGSHVLVVSTQPGEGKSVTSSSLAIAFAQGGRRTLIADFDLRRPQQASIWKLALTPETSFSHCLQRSLATDESVDFDRLANHVGAGLPDVIASLPPEGIYPGMLFGTRFIREFFSWAKKNYDRLVIDAPPWGCIGDVMSLATRIDSTLVMCRPDRTNGYMVEACKRQLNDAGANVIGVVVNDADVASGSDFSIAWRENDAAENGCLERYDLDEVEQSRRYADED